MRHAHAVSAPTRYVRVCALSQGGMGGVDLALRADGRFERLYAMKRLHPRLRGDPEYRTMFFDEARIAGLIRHPNVVSVLDVGEDANGPYLVMEFIEGISCHELMTSVERVGWLPIQVVARLGAQIALGLQASHELTDHNGVPLQIVHRDVSPSNILVGYDGVVRITDFGVAKALGRSTRTAKGVVKGKLGYLSPEQLAFGPLDHRTDLFALGVVLYEVLSGTRLYPFDEDGLRRIMHEPPPDIANLRDDVPPEFVEILFRLLAKDPSGRPESATVVARTLGEVAERLAVEEGAIDVAAFVTDLFRDHRAQERQRRDDALQQAQREQDMVEDLTAELEDEEDAFNATPLARRQPRVPLRWGLMVGLLVIGAVIGVVASWIVAR